MSILSRIFVKKKVPPTIPSHLLSAESAAVFSSLRAGDIAIDCGASVGDVTARMSEQGATVYAFEPNPITFRQLQARFKDTPGVTCFNQGVLDRNTQLPFYFHEDIDPAREDNLLVKANGSSLLSFKGNVSQKNFVEVDVIDLSEFIRQLNRPVKILKIDVEGVEYEILNKLIDTGAYRGIEQILVETHEKKIPELRSKHTALIERIAASDIENINLNWM